MPGRLAEPDSSIKLLTSDVIGAAIEVHRALGPGLLESAYLECLCAELGLRLVAYEREVPIALTYKGHLLDCGYRLDLLIDRRVIVELKAVEKLLPIHEAQVLTYLRLRRLPVGLLINFNVPVLRAGIRRMVNGQSPSAFSAPLRFKID